ncbi:DinB family protein [Nocardioides campestrisoli]|uniref:DinB family protein n=1 Tax=Nocardioides campestrisoli TaxID=2736757 RepID=UPI00163D4F52|nr:DinB family protein [Nocardioides campestrisoli]
MEDAATPSLEPQPPWEPPLAGTEAEHLLGSLERLRATFRWKADGLDEAGLRVALPSSALTLGGLLKHLALVEDHMFTSKLAGTSPGEPWASADWEEHPDWDFTSAGSDAAAELYRRYDDAVRRARQRVGEALDAGGLDHPCAVTGPDGTPASLRRLLFDLVEEYGRHTGHADLLREAVDGRTGEDPPEEWRPFE